jgi:hypothetical protein
MKFAYNLVTAFVCALAMAAGLKGDDQPEKPKIRFGLSTSLVLPNEADFWDNTGAGVSYGIFMETQLTPDVAIRTTAEYIRFTGVEWYNGLKTGAYTMGARCDYVYRIKSHDSGFFFFAGLGFLSATSTAKYAGLTLSDSASTVDYSAGLGYDFGNLGVEVRYVQTGGLKFETAFRSEQYSCWQLGARTRF